MLKKRVGKKSVTIPSMSDRLAEERKIQEERRSEEEDPPEGHAPYGVFNDVRKSAEKETESIL